MWLIDCDNTTKVLIHKANEEEIKRLISSGEVEGMDGAEDLGDCLDLNGDVCVDCDMYTDIKDKLKI